MIFRNNRGFSLLEVLVASAVIMVIMPLLTSILISSMEDYISGTKIIEQQDKVNNVYNMIRKDVEMASDVMVTTSSAIPNFSDSIQLIYKNTDPLHGTDKMDRKYSFNITTGDLVVAVTTSTTVQGIVLTGIDNTPISTTNTTPKSGIFYQISERKMWIKIFPKNVNTTFFKGRNFANPVTIYFDVFNKNVFLNGTLQ